MAKAVRTRGQQQTETVKLLHSLQGRYTLWSIWQDFIQMFAISVANVFPGPYREAREKRYLDIAKKYSKEELNVFAELMAQVVIGMETNPDQDFLGELFMAMELGSNWHGQFFTPYDLCRAMAAIEFSGDIVKAQIEEKGFIGVSDPACGAGALLIAFANECNRAHVNYQQHCLFVAQDIDELAAMMCYIQLSLMGCPGHVIVGDTLANPARFYDDRSLLPVDGQKVWTTPMMYSDTWQIRQIAARMDLMAMHTGHAPEKVVEKLKAVPKEPEKILVPVELPELKADETGQLSLF